LAVWSVFAWGAARALIVKDGVTRADALVVLSGSSVYRERARRAARLFHEGAASKIILTSDGQQGGWSQTEQRNPFFVERAAAELERAGVPRERVEMVPQTVTSTYTEALVLKDYATRHGITSLLVVTSGYHSRRARWSLRRVFKESGVAVGVEPVAPGDETASPVAWWLQPDGWRMVVSEYVKLIYYKWHYDD
jgi:uncharacterized SAM-binding protein YcdF (DUF218 family)